LLRGELTVLQKRDGGADMRRRFVFRVWFDSTHHGHGLRMPSFDRNVPLRGS
jgi:hypothetical protein